jgi:plastocyanin
MKTRKPLVTLLVIIILIGAGYLIVRKSPSASLQSEESGVRSQGEAVIKNTPAVPAAKTSAERRAETAYTSTRSLVNGRYITTVTLTSTGFVPQIVSVGRGESVRFVNKSGGSMRIASNEYQGVPLLQGLNQERTVGANGTFEITLTEVGVWGYHNGVGTASSPNGIVYVK